VWRRKPNPNGDGDGNSHSDGYVDSHTYGHGNLYRDSNGHC
jgi:hypothetical protein